MTKARLLEQIDREWQALQAILAQVPPEWMVEPGVHGSWSVKDIMAHIAVWQQRMVGWMEVTLRGEEPQILPPGLTWDNLDEWNERTYQENRGRPLEDVRAHLQRSYEQARRIAAAAPEADLLAPRRFPWRKENPLWYLVAANTCWHYAEHAQAIREWLKRLSV